MDDISIIVSSITTISILIGIIFTVMEIRHFNKTRKTEIIMKIYNRFSKREMVEAVMKIGTATFESLEDYRDKYGFTEFSEVATLFEGLGVLLEQKLIDIKMVDRLFGPSLNTLWERMIPIINGMRKGLNEPFFFSHFENLIKRLNIYRKKEK